RGRVRPTRERIPLRAEHGHAPGRADAVRLRRWPRAGVHHQVPQEEAPLTFRAAVVDDAIRRVLDAVRRVPRPRILIDGRSGAGKTTIAHRIADELGARVVSLDEFYPGWSGLAAATEIAGGIVREHREGSDARYRRWDWERDVWSQECLVDPERALIVEGCGALTAASARDATASMWFDGDADARYAAAIAR